MAIQAPYKKYKRGQRQANVETNFTNHTGSYSS